MSQKTHKIATLSPEDNPSLIQRRAADPRASVWLGASAGSGKTKVLTDRLLRLLLPQEDGAEGTAPHRILCLTFTKAAASEMALRLNRRLGRWAVMTDTDLRQDMDDLLGRAPTDDECAAARRLFAAVVDTPGGLKIMTIHAFCQSVLGRFPLEAGLPPYFKGLEDAEAARLRARARADILSAARAEPDSRAGRDLAILAAAQGEEGFDRLLDGIIGERHQLQTLIDRHGGLSGLCAAVSATLGCPEGMTPADVRAEAVADGAFDNIGLRGACRALAEYGTEKTDQPKSVAIQNFLDDTAAGRLARYEAYRDLFLTREGLPRKTQATAKVQAAAPEAVLCLTAESERLITVEEQARRAQCALLTSSLLRLGLAVLQRYDELKNVQAALDFDDLILKTVALLSRADMAGWVMYKLDGGLDHILIDEAQDTNPEQWAIIQALTQDFFAGESANADKKRTIFTVGDEKQSIYSFQRAAPDKFNEMRAYFSARISGLAGHIWRNEPMSVSFRSAPAVLQAVDSVFAPEPVRAGLGLHDVRHVSFRDLDAGLVELWPLFTTPARDDRDPWDVLATPADSRGGAARLADHIGQTIRGWLDSGEILTARGRAVTPGDIMILVRSRTAFVNQLIRALKTRHIPVSGLDRMVLKDQLPVQDLLAAAHFALLPEDDLSLACLLKSPLIGWDDAALEACAAGRPPGLTLWTALQTHEAARDIRPYLNNIIARAGRDHPYEFFSRLLQEPCPGSAQGGLHAMTGRLGAEALDPLEEFVNLALSYEEGNIPALQGFLMAVESGDSEIKRQQEDSSGQVRIMTVHGSKGLEAPIVILPDTVRTMRTPPGVSTQRLVWPDRTGHATPLWSPRKADDPALYSTLLSRMDARQDEEYRRLLYVAMTRAEDRLYIGGYRGGKQPLGDSWYNYAQQALTTMPDSQPLPFTANAFAAADDEPAMLYRYETPQKRPVTLREKHAATDDTMPAGAVTVTYPWLLVPPALEPLPPRPLVPSRPAGGDEPSAPSPLATDDKWRFRRGIMTHKLLQFLPDLPPQQRADAAHAWCARQGDMLAPDMQQDIAREVLAILDHPDYAPLFGPDSLAEVPVTGMVGTDLVSGQIDRLLVTPTEIGIVDFKTNRPPPLDERDIPPLYTRQMKLYAEIVSRIYPGRTVRAWLLWTDGPRLMPVTLI